MDYLINVDTSFKCMSIYKLKPESYEAITNSYEEAIILTDEKFGDQTYIFVPVDQFKGIRKDLTSKLMGSYNEVVPGDLSGHEVKKMFDKINYKPEVRKGDEGFLEGFGSVLFYVCEVVDKALILTPVDINLFKPIEVYDLSKFTLAKEQTDKTLDYSWTCEIAIDCDIFPNLVDNPFSYELHRCNLVTILHNIYSILNQVKVTLLNPCDILLSAGMSLGLTKTTFGVSNILSDSVGSSIRVNPKNNYIITRLNKINRIPQTYGKVHKDSLISLFKYLSVSGHLQSTEIYQLLNNMYFRGDKMLDISLPYNPLDMSKD